LEACRAAAVLALLGVTRLEKKLQTMADCELQARLQNRAVIALSAMNAHVVPVQHGEVEAVEVPALVTAEALITAELLSPICQACRCSSRVVDDAGLLFKSGLRVGDNWFCRGCVDQQIELVRDAEFDMVFDKLLKAWLTCKTAFEAAVIMNRVDEMHDALQEMFSQVAASCASKRED